MAATLVGLLAIVLSIVFAWPQAIQARRSDDVSGISGHATLLLLFTSSTWLLYGIGIADFAVIVANAATVAAVLVTTFTLQQRGVLALQTVIRMTGAWLATLGLVVAASVVAGWGAASIGWMGAVLGIAMTVPQAWRAATGHGTEGVSLASYLLLFTVVATWFVYGLLEANPVVWFPNALALCVVGVVIAVLVRAEPDARVSLAPAAE